MSTDQKGLPYFSPRPPRSTVDVPSSTRFYRRDPEPSSSFSTLPSSSSLRRLRMLGSESQSRDYLNYNNNNNNNQDVKAASAFRARPGLWRPSSTLSLDHHHHRRLAEEEAARRSPQVRRPLFETTTTTMTQSFTGPTSSSSSSSSRYSIREAALTRAVEAADDLRWSSRKLLTDVQKNFSQSLIDLDIY